MEYSEILEGLLFLSGDDGLTEEEIKKILDVEDCLSIINELQLKYTNNGGLELICLGNHYKLVTKAKYYKKMIDSDVTGPLSQAALEVLAIIAYNEPITRVQIDEIRGVSSVFVMRKLLLRGLICESGRADVAGHPILYKTTDKFLDYFGLSSRDDLIKINKEFEVIESIDLFDTKYTESD